MLKKTTIINNAPYKTLWRRIGELGNVYLHSHSTCNWMFLSKNVKIFIVKKICFPQFDYVLIVISLVLLRHTPMIRH